MVTVAKQMIAESGRSVPSSPRRGRPQKSIPGASPVRSHEERRCFILGPTQSRISPSILEYTKIVSGLCSGKGRADVVTVAKQIMAESGRSLFLTRCL